MAGGSEGAVVSAGTIETHHHSFEYSQWSSQNPQISAGLRPGTVHARQVPRSAKFHGPGYEPEQPQKGAITMLPKFNENTRQRHTFTAMDIRSHSQSIENGNNQIGIKRKATGPPRISPSPGKRHDGMTSAVQNHGRQTPLGHFLTNEKKNLQSSSISQDGLLDLTTSSSKPTSSLQPHNIHPGLGKETILGNFTELSNSIRFEKHQPGQHILGKSSLWAKERLNQGIISREDPLSRTSTSPGNRNHDAISRGGAAKLERDDTRVLVAPELPRNTQIEPIAAIVNSGKDPAALKQQSRSPNNDPRPQHCSPDRREEDQWSIASSNTRSSLSAGAARKCHFCGKSPSTSYDSLSKCSTCSRHFHDGCRKPPLSNLEDRTLWQCYRCVFKKRPSIASTDDGITSRRNSQSATPTFGDERSYRTLSRSRHRPEKPTQDSLSLTITSESPARAPLSDEGGLRQERGDRCLLSGTNHFSAEANKYPKETSFEAIEDPEFIEAISTSSVQGTGNKQSHTNVEIVNATSPLASVKLCAHCGLRRVLGQMGVGNAVCHKCKQRNARSEEDAPGLIIPETPVSTPTARRDDGIASNAVAPASATSSTGMAVHTGFWSNTILSTTKIKKKKAQVKGLSPEKKDVDKEHVQVNTQGLQLATSPAHLNRGLAAVLQGAARENGGNRRDAEELTVNLHVQRNLQMRPSKDECKDGTAATDTLDVNVQARMDTPKPSDPILPESVRGQDTSSPCTHSEVVRDNIIAASPKSPSQIADMLPQNFSTRVLIGMALVAAKGTPLTAGEIGTWIESTFPQAYKRGKGTWYKNIHPTLCQRPEFEKVECHGERTKKWTFANANAKKAYSPFFNEFVLGLRSKSQPKTTQPPAVETDTSPQQKISRRPNDKLLEADSQPPYQARIIETASQNPQPNGDERGDQAHVEQTNVAELDARSIEPEIVSLGQAANRLEALLEVKSPGKRSTQNKSLIEVIKFLNAENTRSGTGGKQTTQSERSEHEHEQSSCHELEKDEDHPNTLSAPFQPERADFMRVNLDTRVENNLFKAFPEFNNNHVESMTEEEKDAKIALIQKRPSRKANFGSLLASARTFRDDVHNELEQTRSPAAPMFTANMLPVRSERRAAVDGEIEMSEAAVVAKSLKIVSDLPERPIPMIHEGHLAFRDGSLVNGKLPRSRAVFKIGKK